MEKTSRSGGTTRRALFEVSGMALGGAVVSAVLPACVASPYGQPFGPPLTVGPGENGVRLYSFLANRFRIGYVPKRDGPLIVEIGGTQGGFEFVRNGGDDPLNSRRIGAHRLSVALGEQWQILFRSFADAEERTEALRRERMSAEDVRIMASIT